VDDLRKPFAPTAEWFVLGLVVLAILSIGIESESDSQGELEVTHLSGTITLSTRSSMNALGLDDYDRGAKATLDIQVQGVVSSQCVTCIGISMQGPVNITELMGAGTGRIEANIAVLHLQEHVGDGLIAREWLSFHWDVTGGDDFTWDITIVHSPPMWQPEDRFNAGFSEGESRTGPWILIESMLGGAYNVQGCLPERSMPCLISQPDIELTSVIEPVKSPLSIPHPANWTEIQNVSSTNETPSKTEQVRDLLNVGKPTLELHAWCNNDSQEIDAAFAWSIEGSGTTAVAPMSIYLEALALPSTSFTPVSGTWTEVESQNQGCASLVDDNGLLRIGISISEF